MTGDIGELIVTIEIGNSRLSGSIDTYDGADDGFAISVQYLLPLHQIIDNVLNVRC